MSQEANEWSDIESSNSSNDDSSSSSESLKHRKRDKKHKKRNDNGVNNNDTTNNEKKASKRDADIDLEHLYAVSIGDLRKRARFDHNINDIEEDDDDEEEDSSYSHSSSSSSDHSAEAGDDHDRSIHSSSSSSDSSDDAVDREAQRILKQPEPVISSYESSSTNSSIDDSGDDASDCSIDVSNYDVCKARYQLLYDKEQRYTALSPEERERYRRQLELSVWGPLNETSFNLEGEDRKQVFSDYANVALLELLPSSIEPSEEATKCLTKILKF